MRVLMINRSDASLIPGGAKIQVEKTAFELGKLGVNSVIKSWESVAEQDFQCDLVHIFGIQNAEESWHVARRVMQHKLPWVLSPIYWTPYEQWFGLYGQYKRGWRAVRNIGGYRAAYRIYDAWQRLKISRSEIWRKQRELVRLSGAVLPNSNTESEIIIKDFRISSRLRQNFYAIPNGIDADVFTSENPVTNDCLDKLGTGFVLQVGRISREKNNHGLIQALFYLPLPIVFVGPQINPHDPSYLQECLCLAKDRGKVTFTGEIPYSELPAIYSRAGVHVLPSWRETPGLVSLEAAICGCNVVSTSIGSAREYLGDSAWYCHPGYPETIRNAVVEARNAPFPERLKSKIRDQYTWQRAAQKTLGAYEYALSQS